MISSNSGRSAGEITPSSAMSSRSCSRCCSANARTRLMMRMAATGNSRTATGGSNSAATWLTSRKCCTARYWLS